MSESIVLLEEARGWRVRAQQVRHLIWGIADKKAVEALAEYAAELESKAGQLEAHAERIADLAAEI